MIDVRKLRTDLEATKAAMARRRIDTSPLDDAAELDRQLREIALERDNTRRRVNELSKQVGQLRKAGDVAASEAAMAESRALGDTESELAARATRIETELRDILLRQPNLPADDCPDGAGEHDNVITKVVGFDPDSYGEHQRVAHWDIGAQHGILDLERGAKLSGSMFVMYRGQGAALNRALQQYALDSNVDAYEEIRPPTVVKTDTMVSTGHLPKFEEDAYAVERDDLWLIPTAEVPLTSLARDEVLDEAALPMRLMAYTSCYRREAGSAGKDTRGLLRIHEFDKVEILAYCTPAQAAEVHADILGRAERIIASLGLAYRVLDLCTGDIGNSAARTFDIEVYSPGCDKWLEVSSVSWFSDYQARRANVRYKSAVGKGTEIVHTLNGSALAVPRVWAALVETHRQPDGTVAIPEPLLPYMRGRTHIG
ncbi:MAG: serine--tRNA ligase [Acidimicrobiia bacterium]